MPRLEDGFNLGNEGRDFGPDVGMIINRSQEVQKLIADEVVQGLLGAKLVLDAPGRLALLDSDFARVHSAWSSAGKREYRASKVTILADCQGRQSP